MNIFKLQIGKTFRYFLFYLVILIISILPLATYRFGKIESIFPAIEIIIIFFFSIYKPDYIPLSVLFSYGIILDLIYGLPIGISIIPVLTTSFLLRNQRQIFFRKDFTIVFIGFALACFMFLILKYFVFSWYYVYFINFSLVVVQAVSTILFYPLMHYFLQQIEKFLE